MSTFSVEQKLAVDKFYIDEGNPHIILKENITDREALEKIIKACPAGLYALNPDGSVRFDFAGCLECGTCRVLGLGTVLDLWQYPQGTCGVEFRYG
ncbi:MAG TPA: ferredoxin family protein [Clostridia bacterium]|nr:ferredoxin family protein [Clostridia bacterium]